MTGDTSEMAWGEVGWGGAIKPSVLVVKTAQLLNNADVILHGFSLASTSLLANETLVGRA